MLSLGLVVSPLAASEVVRLDYRAPEGCPHEEEFARRLSERLTRARLAVPEEFARTLLVELTLDAEGATGRLEFVSVSGESFTRSMRGPTCDEVASGMALVAALAVDADPIAVEPPPGEPEPSPPPPPPPPLPPPRLPPPPPPPPPPPRLPPDEPSGWFVGAGGGFVTWASPGAALALSLGGGYELDELGPHFRVEAFTTRGSASADQREASLTSYGGRLEGCPFALGVRRMVRVEPCLASDLGIFFAQGQPSAALPTARTESSFWFSATALARGGLFLGFGWLEAAAELGLPITRKEYIFERPRARAFTVPALGFGARAGLTVQIQ